MKLQYVVITSLALSAVLSSPAKAQGPRCGRQLTPVSQASSFFSKWFERYLVDRLKLSGWSCQHGSQDNSETTESTETTEPSEPAEPTEPAEPIASPLEFNFPQNGLKDKDWHNTWLTNESDTPIKVVLEFNEVKSGTQQGKLEINLLPRTARQTNFFFSFPDERLEAHQVWTSVKVFIPEGAENQDGSPVIFIDQVRKFDPAANLEPRSNGIYQCWKTHCDEITDGGTKHEAGPDYN